jgi:hypothetical protein
MRLGILGPAGEDVVALADAARLLLDEAHTDKVIYVSPDGAMDRVVFGWAHAIVGADPSGEALFLRAATRCVNATPAEIDEFVALERARARLNVLVSLPAASTRTIEILDGRVVLFVHDKAYLDEEDIAAAQMLVFGHSPEPLVRRVGTRMFLSPGPIGCPRGGAAVLDDSAGGIQIEMLGPGGAVVAREHFTGVRPGKLRVQGGP